ncbi:unnamed protein product, partial [Allacma fusca]
TPEDAGDGMGNFTHPALLGRQNDSGSKSHLSLSTGSGARGIHRSPGALPVVLAFNNLFSWPLAITISVMTALHISNGWHHHPRKSP